MKSFSGIEPNTLSDHPKMLDVRDIIARRLYCERQPRRKHAAHRQIPLVGGNRQRYVRLGRCTPGKNLPNHLSD